MLLERPFSERRAALERLLADVGGHPVSLTPQEPTHASAPSAGCDTAEGVIAKQADAPYLPGQAHWACSRCGGGARSTA